MLFRQENKNNVFVFKLQGVVTFSMDTVFIPVRTRDVASSLFLHLEYNRTLILLVWPTSWTPAVGGLLLFICVCVSVCMSV